MCANKIISETAIGQGSGPTLLKEDLKKKISLKPKEMKLLYLRALCLM